MSMLKKLKSFFIVEDEELINKSNPSAAKKADIPSPPPVENVSSTVASSSNDFTAAPEVSDGKVTPKFMEILLKAIEQNNLDGFDYLEYKQALKNLAKMPMDEQTRYQSAYAAAQTMGATPDQLVNAANFYIDILGKEQEKFKTALGNQKSRQIVDKEQLVKNLHLQIQDKAKKIELLGKEIEASQKKMKDMKQEISSALVKVESTKNNFVASYNSLVAQIRKDIENMQKYLK